MSMPPQIKHEFITSTTNAAMRSKAAPKKPTFFSIDQILGKCSTETELSDDEVFERDDTSSFDGDSNDVDVDMLNDDNENNKNSDKIEKDNNDKQTPSYTAIIAQAILSSSDKKLPLGCIYEYIAEHFPEFLKKGQGWRNCVRHNLSLSECFIKAGRARNGRGNYWGIHPRYLKNFSKGDFRKRRASHRPRNRDLNFGGRFYPHYYNPYIVTQSYNKSVSYRPGFSVENILSKDRYNATTPPVLSSCKNWSRDEKLSPLLPRSTYRVYSPPVLSSATVPVLPSPPSYFEHYSYYLQSHYGHTSGTHTEECSCQKHHKCPPSRTFNI